MYFKTHRSTETGKKFQIVNDKMLQSLAESKKLCESIGFTAWRRNSLTSMGGFSSLIFEGAVQPDPKVFKVVNGNEWMPKKNTKEGKKIQKQLDSVSVVTIDKLNDCVGLDGAPFRKIGFYNANEEYFIFSVSIDWEFTPPSDCIEITHAEYKQLTTKP